MERRKSLKRIIEEMYKNKCRNYYSGISIKDYCDEKGKKFTSILVAFNINQELLKKNGRYSIPESQGKVIAQILGYDIEEDDNIKKIINREFYELNLDYLKKITSNIETLLKSCLKEQEFIIEMDKVFSCVKYPLLKSTKKLIQLIEVDAIKSVKDYIKMIFHSPFVKDNLNIHDRTLLLDMYNITLEKLLLDINKEFIEVYHLFDEARSNEANGQLALINENLKLDEKEYLHNSMMGFVIRAKVNAELEKNNEYKKLSEEVNKIDKEDKAQKFNRITHKMKNIYQETKKRVIEDNGYEYHEDIELENELYFKNSDEVFEEVIKKYKETNTNLYKPSLYHNYLEKYKVNSVE